MIDRLLAYTGSHECEALSISMMTANVHSKATARDQYVADLVTPILNAMVTDVFRELPDDLLVFLLNWVEARLSGKRLDVQGPLGGHPRSASERFSYRTRVLEPVLEPLSDAVIAAMPECPLLFMRSHLGARKSEREVSIISESPPQVHVPDLDDQIAVDDAEMLDGKSEVDQINHGVSGSLFSWLSGSMRMGKQDTVLQPQNASTVADDSPADSGERVKDSSAAQSSKDTFDARSTMDSGLQDFKEQHTREKPSDHEPSGQMPALQDSGEVSAAAGGSRRGGIALAILTLGADSDSAGQGEASAAVAHHGMEEEGEQLAEPANPAVKAAPVKLVAEREAAQEATKQEGAVEAPTRQMADENGVAIAEKQVDGRQERSKSHTANEQAADKQAAEHASRFGTEVGTPPKHASGLLCNDVNSEGRDKEDTSSQSLADDEGAQTIGEVSMNHRASCPVPRGHVRDYVSSLHSGPVANEPQGQAA